MRAYEELDWIGPCLDDGTLGCQWFGSRDYLYIYTLKEELNDVFTRVFLWVQGTHTEFRCKLIPQTITLPNQQYPIRSMSVIINTPTPHYALQHHRGPPQDRVFMRYLIQKCPGWILYADTAAQ